jgi:hypothetical protein
MSIWLITVVIKNIFCKARNSSSNYENSKFAEQIIQENSKRHLKILKLIIFLMILFFTCRLSQWIFEILKFNIGEAYHSYWLSHYSFGMLTLSNCMLNPFLYMFLLKA